MNPLRVASTLLYLVMALWLLLAGLRRIAYQMTGASAPDFAAYTSASLGACALVLFVVAAIINRPPRVRAPRP